jgi:hypothetical protein
LEKATLKIRANRNPYSFFSWMEWLGKFTYQFGSIVAEALWPVFLNPLSTFFRLTKQRQIKAANHTLLKNMVRLLPKKIGRKCATAIDESKHEHRQFMEANRFFKARTVSTMVRVEVLWYIVKEMPVRLWAWLTGHFKKLMGNLR